MKSLHRISFSRTVWPLFHYHKWRLILFIALMIMYLILFSKSSNFESLTESEKLKLLSAPDMRNISNIVVKMSRGLENPFVMMTLLNKAFLPFALSWLCNTKYMDVHKHVLFLTTDTQTDAMLRHYWPDVTSVVLRGVDSKRNESYSQVGYVKLMVKRTIAILSILEANTAVFLFEVDCLWKRNPLPFLQSQNLVDIVATKVSKEEFVVAGGFLYLFPTNSTKQLWGALTKRLLVLFDKIRFLSPETSVSEGDNDQQYLSILIRKNYVGIRYKLLFDEEFPDGSWYNLTLAERSAMNPYIINNNWLVGNYEKIERAQRWRHWFIRKDFTCDEQNIALNFQNLNSVDSIL